MYLKLIYWYLILCVYGVGSGAEDVIVILDYPPYDKVVSKRVTNDEFGEWQFQHVYNVLCTFDPGVTLDWLLYCHAFQKIVLLY